MQSYNTFSWYICIFIVCGFHYCVMFLSTLYGYMHNCRTTSGSSLHRIWCLSTGSSLHRIWCISTSNMIRFGFLTLQAMDPLADSSGTVLERANELLHHAAEHDLSWTGGLSSLLWSNTAWFSRPLTQEVEHLRILKGSSYSWGKAKGGSL